MLLAHPPATQITHPFPKLGAHSLTTPSQSLYRKLRLNGEWRWLLGTELKPI